MWHRHEHARTRKSQTLPTISVDPDLFGVVRTSLELKASKLARDCSHYTAWARSKWVRTPPSGKGYEGFSSKQRSRTLLHPLEFNRLSVQLHVQVESGYIRLGGRVCRYKIGDVASSASVWQRDIIETRVGTRNMSTRLMRACGR